MPMADRIMLSMPIRVRWGPWQSDTLALQRGGWQVVLDQRIMDQYFGPERRYRLMIREPNSGIIGYAEFRVGGWNSNHPEDAIRGLMISFELYHDSNVVMLHKTHYDIGRMASNPELYDAIDCTPQAVRIGEILPYQIFANAPAYKEVENSEIVVKEESIIELLGRIKEMQQPEQDRIREENKLREKRESGIIVPKVHAKIITLSGN